MSSAVRLIFRRLLVSSVLTLLVLALRAASV